MVAARAFYVFIQFTGTIPRSYLVELQFHALNSVCNILFLVCYMLCLTPWVCANSPPHYGLCPCFDAKNRKEKYFHILGQDWKKKLLSRVEYEARVVCQSSPE